MELQAAAGAAHPAAGANGAFCRRAPASSERRNHPVHLDADRIDFHQPATVAKQSVAIPLFRRRES